jgi:uncharacterized protein YukE
VADPVSTQVDPWAGVWIAEDLELVSRGIKDGSWIETSLGAASAGLDALAVVSDPIGALLQYGVAWIIEHAKPLSQALDWLAGDPSQVGGQAQTWRNVAVSLHDHAADLDRTVRWDTTEWIGDAAEAYRRWAGQQKGAIEALAKAAETLAVVTEAAGLLVAGVRMLVRDAIATLVSRLISYAAEEVFSLGFATPLVVEQVATLCASWAARIGRWLRNLLTSLARLRGAADKVGELIEAVKRLLARLLGRGDEAPQVPRRPSRQELLDELTRKGVKHNPTDILEIGKNGAGEVIFLENGNSRAGLLHIKQRHAGDFANLGVPDGKIGKLVFTAVTEGTVVGTQRTRPIYEVMFEGKTYKIAVSVGSNGFIVGANPVGH